MTLTVADASRSYRQRRAEKMARMEAALREIANTHPARPLPGSYARDIARNALNPGKEMGE